MKKRPLLLISGIVTAILICGITAHAAQRQPSFFIPQKVLDKMNQPEKLPPVQPINYGTPQPAPNPQNIRQNTDTVSEKTRQERAAEAQRRTEEQKAALQRAAEERLEQEKRKKELLEQQKIEKEKRLQAEIERLKAMSENAAKQQDNSAPDGSSSQAAKQETQPPVDTDLSEIMTQATTPESAEAAPLNNSQRTFDDIIADYKRDALGISQGKPVNNPRLRDVLQDYSDERHIL